MYYCWQIKKICCTGVFQGISASGTTVCVCVVAWNRCSSRSSASYNRSEAAIQPGTVRNTLFLSPFLYSFLICLCALLRNAPQIDAVCSSYLSSDLKLWVSELWFSLFFVFFFSISLHLEQITLTLHSPLWYLFQASDVLGELCVMMLVQKSKVPHMLYLYWECQCHTFPNFHIPHQWHCDIVLSSQELKVQEKSKRVSYFPPTFCVYIYTQYANIYICVFAFSNKQSCTVCIDFIPLLQTTRDGT